MDVDVKEDVTDPTLFLGYSFSGRTVIVTERAGTFRKDVNKTLGVRLVRCCSLRTSFPGGIYRLPERDTLDPSSADSGLDSRDRSGEQRKTTRAGVPRRTTESSFK